MISHRLPTSSKVLCVEPTPVISGLRLVAAPGARSALVQHLNAWVDGVRRSPGCMKVTTVQQDANPNVLYAVVEWENEAALEAFRASQAAKDLARPLVTLLAEKAQTTRFRADEVEEETISL
jgi:quinol monooxygenase YgiN